MNHLLVLVVDKKDTVFARFMGFFLVLSYLFNASLL